MPQKRYLLYCFLLVAFMLPTFAHAQDWRLQESGVTAELLDICFVDTAHGWACGRDGVIVATTDGGETWSRQNTGINSVIVKLKFVSPKSGWALFGGKNFLYTSDGGSSWGMINLPDSIMFINFTFIDELHGWAHNNGGVVGNGAIFKTFDGGVSWKTVLDLRGPGIPSMSFTCMEFLDITTGFAAGAEEISDNFSEGRIWRTSDGGESWTMVHTRTGIIRDLAVHESGTILTGSFSILASSMSLSTDEGITWEDLEHQEGPDVHSSYSSSVAIAAPNILWAVAEGIIYSEDTGKTWHKTTRESSGVINDMEFVDSTHGWMVGAEGHIWRYHPPEPVGVEELTGVTEFSITNVYPNPITNARQTTVLLYNTGRLGSIEITIYDLLGRAMNRLKAPVNWPGEQNIILPLEGMKPGMYIIEGVQHNAGGMQRSCKTIVVY